VVDPIEIARRHEERGSLTRAEEEAMWGWESADMRAYIEETRRLGPAEAPVPWSVELKLIAAVTLGYAIGGHHALGGRTFADDLAPAPHRPDASGRCRRLAGRGVPPHGSAAPAVATRRWPHTR
jgi:hypothetical protein